MESDNNLSICFIKASGIFELIRGEGAGGAERQIYLLAKEFTNRDFDVSIITESFEGPEETFIEGIQIVNGPESATTDASAVCKVHDYWATLRNTDADYYYVRGDTGILTIVNLFTHVYGGQVIFNVSNDPHIQTDSGGFKTFLSEKVLEYSLNDISFNIAQTERQQMLLKQNYGASSYVIPNGYTVPPQEELVPMADREYILWVGRLNQVQKKPMRYLELAEELPKIEFRMIGPVDEDDAFQRKVKARATSIDNVEFLGFVPPEEIHDHYQNAVALVNTSDWEGFPNTFLEAWRYGTPTVSLFHPMDGLLEDEVCGIFSGDFKALIKDVERVATDCEFASELSERTRQTMESKYSMEAVVDLYEAMLEEN